MSQPYVGQIQPYAFNFAPRGWAMCNGQIMQIQQNPALFTLLGNMYGGNGSTNFALPDLRSRVPMHSGTSMGTSYPQGETAGEENVTLTSSTTPMHTHFFYGSSAPGTGINAVDGIVFATSSAGSGTPDNFYGPAPPTLTLNPTAITFVGGSQSHTNLQPYLTINWCISLYGVFPSRN